MSTLSMVVHVVVCFVLILVVLLQRGKGSDIGAALGGGGGNTVFGARGAGNFLTKVTTGAAITFMLTSLSLSYVTTQESNLLVIDEEEVVEQTAISEVLDEVDAVDAPDASGASADELVEIDPDGANSDSK
jgi:preprotein translocase subunit SecG